LIVSKLSILSELFIDLDAEMTILGEVKANNMTIQQIIISVLDRAHYKAEQTGVYSLSEHIANQIIESLRLEGYGIKRAYKPSLSLDDHTQYLHTAESHKAADLAMGRQWECACGACNIARRS
jgi:hypothetical protein